MSNGEMKNPAIKIAITGIANAGKTTLVRTLQHRYHVGDNLPPTKNVERNQISLFGSSAAIWDFGGQTQYRTQYISNPDRYFSELAFLFYIIDVQDSQHFAESLEYFKNIFNHARSLNNKLIIVVLFHKMDPPLLTDTSMLNKVESVKKEIFNLVEGAEVSFFNTTIYDPLTVLDAFSKPILGDMPIYNAISVLFANFSISRSIEYMNLMVDNLLELGSFRLRTPNAQFVDATLKFYQQFSNIEIDQKLRKYEYEGYEFLIISGKIATYNYTLNLVRKLEPDSIAPSDQDLASILTEIEDAFQKYQPKFT